MGAVRPQTTPRKSPRQERARATVEAILSATAQLLVRDGYERTSTNRVATAAGVSIGSLYQYFPSKEALVAALIEHHGKEMQVVLEREGEALDKPLAEVTRSLVRALLAAHAIDPKLHRVLMEQVPRVGLLEKIADIDTHIIQMLRTVLKAHASELRDKDLDLALFVLYNAVEAITHAATLDRIELLHDNRLENEIVDLALRYLLKQAPP
jgi:AcrR family transcriptional regulator